MGIIILGIHHRPYGRLDGKYLSLFMKQLITNKAFGTIVISSVSLLLFYLNHYYIGLSFISDYLVYVISLVLAISIGVASVSLLRRKRSYGLIGLLGSIVILFFLLMGHFVWLYHTEVDEFVVDDDMIINVDYYPDAAMYTFILEEDFKYAAGLITQKRCVYWAMSPNADGISWTVEDSTLLLSGMAIGVNGVGIELDNISQFDGPCSCYNDYYVELNVCHSN